MKLRKIISLTALLSFVLMLLTSAVLYIAPQGRIAYWSDWRMLGLSKTDWGNIHINLGFLFLIAIGLHIYYNWKPLTAYLKNKAKQLKIFTPDFIAALVVVLFCAVGTYFLVPPFGWVMTLNDHFKAAAAQKYGEPPYGHAELSSLKSFAKKLDLDLDKSLVLLKRAGYPAESAEMTLAQIARQNGATPQALYLAIVPAAVPEDQAGERGVQLPADPPPGTGNLTLAELSARYNLDLNTLLRQLEVQGIEAGADQTIKTIADAHQKGPVDIYEAIKESIAAGM